MLGIARGVARRAGSALRGKGKSATRKDETGKNVRMSKDSSSGVMREVASGKGAGKQKTPAARKARKAEGSAASGLKQPARGSLGQIAEDADSGMRPSSIAARQANKFDEALAKKEKTLKGYRKKAAKLKGKELIKYTQKYITPLRASIDDMKDRGGPGGKSKRFIKKNMGGKVVKKNMGGNLKSVNTEKNPGLAKLPTPVRNKMGFAKGGGKVVKKNKGGKIEKEKELNKRLRAIGVGGKTGTMRSGLRAAGKSADKRESKVDRPGQKKAAKDALKMTFAPAASMLFGDYEPFKSKKKRKPSMEGDMIDLNGGGKIVKKKKSIKTVDRDISSDQFPEASKFVNKRGGGKIKGYKKGGPITYRMTGGQVVDNSYD